MSENMILQALSFEKQAQFLTTRAFIDVGFIPAISPSRWGELNSRIERQLELIYGFSFNQDISTDILESRAQFGEIVTRALEAGQLGPAPRNLRPDLKISMEEAKRRRLEGENIPDWYVRSEDEEKIVEKMIADWKRIQGDI